MARQKRAIVDYWTLCQNFSRGDIVQTYNNLNGGLEGYAGLVTAVHPGIGFIDVEFPWGNQRVSPELLVKQNPRFLFNYPSFIDTSYDSWDIDLSHMEDGTEDGYSYAHPRNASIQDPAARLAVAHSRRQKTLRTAACQCKFAGLDEVDSYKAMNRVLHSDYGDSEIRDAIATVFSKQALYWSAPGRKYRMNKGEIDDGLPNCPHCDTNLLKTNYKKHTKLFVCPRCLFCIKPSDIEGLPGQVADEGFGTEDEGAEEIGEVDIVATALREARQEMRGRIPSLKWDTLKKQAVAWVKKHLRNQRDLAEKAAIDLVNEYASEMNTHEEGLPEKVLGPRLKEIVYSLWYEDLKQQVADAFKKAKPPFNDAAEQAAYAMDYLSSLDRDEFLNVDEKEIERLVEVGRDLEAELVTRQASGLRAALASSSPTLLEVREALGADGLQRIYSTVIFNARSDTVAAQFEEDFARYGLGDAMFLLGASTADGLFDRNAYNALVDVLDHVRGGGR